jgi:hypothetical protein
MLSHFERRRQELLSFIAAHQRFPATLDEAEELPGERLLGEWVREQRDRYSRASVKYRHLDAWVAELEAIPGWDWTPQRSVERGSFRRAVAESVDDSAETPKPPRPKWLDSLRKLRAFAEENGRLPTNADLPGISAWIRRHQYFYGAGTLTRDRIEFLEAVPGWTWELSYQNDGSVREPRPTWIANYNRLVEFTDEHARLPIFTDDARLAAWVALYGGKYRRDELDVRKRELLDLLPVPITG